MRRNMFGNPYIGPEDDLGAIFATDGLEADYGFAARFLEEYGEDELTPGWGCSITDDDGDEVAYLEGFATKQDLIDYATSFGLTVED